MYKISVEERENCRSQVLLVCSVAGKANSVAFFLKLSSPEVVLTQIRFLLATVNTKFKTLGILQGRRDLCGCESLTAWIVGVYMSYTS